jgi:hypothetical protein
MYDIQTARMHPMSVDPKGTILQCLAGLSYFKLVAVVCQAPAWQWGTACQAGSGALSTLIGED